MQTQSIVRIAAPFVFTAVAAGCQTAYYNTMEKLGWDKRDILVDRVEEARDAQEAAKEQFRSALEEFQAVVAVDGGELERKYDKLSTEFKRSEAKATAVTERIDSVESVGNALFKEWENELEQYSNDELRRSSQRKLVDTRARYNDLVGAMRRAEAKIAPVLDSFRDQVLYLKHNLNARAIASLRTELASVENETEALIRAMESSIAEADEFIRTMAQ